MEPAIPASGFEGYVGIAVEMVLCPCLEAEMYCGFGKIFKQRNPGV